MQTRISLPHQGLRAGVGVGLALLVALAGCVQGPGHEAAAGVVVPCPGTSDPMPAGLPCGLVCRAALPIRASDSSLFLVDVQVDDKPALMVLDTGSDRTRLSPRAAARIGLPPAQPAAEGLLSLGGVVPASSTTMQSVLVGHARIGPGRIDVLPPTQGVAGTGDLGFDGLLGNDILSHYQLDLDFKHHVVRLYEGRLCPGPLPGWPAEASVLRFASLPDNNLVGVAAALNGEPFKALLDTGLEATVAWETSAGEFHLQPSELARDSPIRLLGIGPGGSMARLHQFQTLGLGTMAVPNPPVAIMADHTEHPVMIVGDTVLSTRRVWIDYAGRLVHFGVPD